MALNLMNFFNSGGNAGLDALLSADQRKLMNRNANLSAAAALLQAGGRSRQRVGLGQALGAALQAGQQGYQQARTGSLQELLMGEKLKESQDERQRNLDYFEMIKTAGQPAPAAPGLAAPGPTDYPVMPLTVQTSDNMREVAPPAQMVPQAPMAAPAAASPFSGLTQQQLAIMRGLPRAEGLKYAMDALKPEPTPESIRTLRALRLPETVEGLRQLDKPEASPSEVRILQATGTPVTMENVIKLRQSSASNVKVNVPVDMTGGQKGFENEMKLGSAFKSEPIYKDFNDMKAAFSQVVSSLSAGTPIGDVAGATKIMKLLDPGSVVRESELGIAMAAAGRLDRLQNYFNNLMTGEKLTPTQREDFKSLANELYAAAGQAYNQKRDEYQQFGQAYNFKNLGTALGPAANIPSVMRGSTPSAPGGSGKPRRRLDDIFGGQ